MEARTQRMSATVRNAALAAVAVSALAVRAAHVATILHSPAGDALVQDARAYQAEATLRLSGSAATSKGGPSFMNLGYPYALAAVYTIAGPRVGAMLGVQSVLGALSCVLLALTAGALFESAWAAIVTGAAYALYRPAVFYDGLLLTPSLTGFAVAASLYAAVSGSQSPRLRYGLLAAAGAAAGCAAILRPNVLLLAPVLAAVAAWLSPASARLRCAAAVFCGTVVVVLPVAIAQRVTHGAWVPLSANGGMNFWTGNQRDAQGAYAPAPFVEEQNAESEESGFLEEARRRSGRATMSLADSSGFWLEQGQHDITSDPARWVRLEGRKLLLLGSRLEVRTNVSLGFYERLSTVLRLAPVTFPLLFTAGIMGLALLLSARRYGEALLVASTILVATATCALFFVSGEYRHLAASGLALGAGALVAIPVTGRRRAVVAIAGAIALTWSLAYAPRDIADASDPAIDFSNLARAICTDGIRAGNAPEALRRADALLDLAPGDLAKRIYIVDARFWVRALATRDGSPETLVRALDAANALVAALPELASAAYSAPFRLRVRSTLGDRLKVLAGSPLLATDVVLRERMTSLLARARP